ncbi:MAG: hypothetical protein QMD36_04775 [Candidatus Aenigmarchaeota archaeon]|nr:hypothetical protein [Candidatus Aenigmarchaeota archaeon]
MKKEILDVGMKFKRVYPLIVLLATITLSQTSDACNIYYRNDRWERNDSNCTHDRIWVYDWNHYSMTRDCACAIKFHPCRGFIDPFGPNCGEDMCYDYGHNDSCELGLEQYTGERVKLAWGPSCNPPLGGEKDDLVYDPNDGPVVCSGKLEVGRNNCNEPFDQNIPIAPGRCESACGADPGCDEVSPSTSWCDGNINKTCDSNCNYSEKCDYKCGAHPRCDGLKSGEGCCSGCYYVDLNDNRKIEIIDITKVAKAFDQENPTKEDVNSDGVVDEEDIEICQKFKDPRCDIDGDGDVDIYDIIKVSKARGTQWEHGNADINNDRKVNIIDISLIAKKFGQKC